MEQKKQLYEAVDRMADRLTGMADFIFDHPETDGNEVQAAALLTDFLKENGFVVEMGCGAACPPHSRGVLREPASGSLGQGPDSPGSVSSASTTPWRTWDTAAATTCRDLPAWSGPGGEGGFKKPSLRPGGLRHPAAEETFGGKVNMIKAGCFEDIDVALMMHGAPDTCTD